MAWSLPWTRQSPVADSQPTSPNTFLAQRKPLEVIYENLYVENMKKLHSYLIIKPLILSLLPEDL